MYLLTRSILLGAPVLINNEGKKLEVNGKLIKRHIDYLGNLRIIIFSPDDIRLLKDSPSNRRRFLNIEVIKSLNSSTKFTSKHEEKKLKYNSRI